MWLAENNKLMVSNTKGLKVQTQPHQVWIKPNLQIGMMKSNPGHFKQM